MGQSFWGRERGDDWLLRGRMGRMRLVAAVV